MRGLGTLVNILAIVGGTLLGLAKIHKVRVGSLLPALLIAPMGVSLFDR